MVAAAFSVCVAAAVTSALTSSRVRWRQLGGGRGSDGVCCQPESCLLNNFFFAAARGCANYCHNWK
ncbi:hypothetical protein PF008_g14000 [Phytophthora fragariae]|uniref:Secreted protein n=1 Tax=Phytophthora fragariae TaxID=53985 RepID=A0A6G0RIB6_9STRA|nr:hypothetical protein PF008_g14000 [Phytophthora fragariae]